MVCRNLPHYDHIGGINALQKFSGARVLSSKQGALALRAGDVMQDDPLYGQWFEHRSFPAIQNVAVVADGATRHPGDAGITGMYTAGHTPGGMSWTWNTCERERCLDIVYADSISAVSADNYRFTSGLGDALRQSAERIAALECDVLLVTHPFLYEMKQKYALDRDAFVDEQACNDYGSDALQQLQERLTRELP